MTPLLILVLAALAAPARAQDAPKNEACVAAYQGAYQQQWALTREVWTQRCEAGGAADAVLEKAKKDFQAQCLKRLAPQATPQPKDKDGAAPVASPQPGAPGSAAGGPPAAPNEKISPEKARELCAQGLPGQKKLEAAAGKGDAAGGGSDEAGGDKKRQADEKRGESLGQGGKRLDALGAGVGARVKSDVAGLYGERTAKLESGPGVVAAPAPTGSRRAPLPPPPGVSVPQRLHTNEVPAPNSPADLNARVDRLPYDPKIKSYLHIVVGNADGVDARRTVETLERYHPILKSDYADHGNYGEAWHDSDGHHINLTPAYVTANGKETAYPPSTGRYEDLRRKDAEMPPVPLAVKDPGNRERRDLGMVDGKRVYQYPDGSKRWEYSDVSQAGTLMHEVQHVRRDGEGGGANDYTDERDAHDVQYRFYTRIQQRTGGKIELDEFKTGLLHDWQTDPRKFDQSLKERYGPDGNGHIKNGQVTPDEQMDVAQLRLRLAENEVGWTDKLYHWAKGQNTKDLDKRDDARDTVQRLEGDKRLAPVAAGEQAAWRAQREAAFKATLQQKVDALRAQAEAMPEKTKKQKAARQAALNNLQQMYDAGMANPWEYIPLLPPQ